MPFIRLPDAFARYAGGEAQLTVAAGTVGAALEEAFRRHPELRSRLVDDTGMVRPYLALFHNDAQLARAAAAGAALGPQDTLTILEAIGGGAAGAPTASRRPPAGSRTWRAPGPAGP